MLGIILVKKFRSVNPGEAALRFKGALFPQEIRPFMGMIFWAHDWKNNSGKKKAVLLPGVLRGSFPG